MATMTPNMGLLLSTVGVDTGLQWELNLNTSINTLDRHDHSPGKGVAINQASISLSGDLPLNQNNLTLVRSVRFSQQSMPLAGASDLGCAYVSGVDLWFNDRNGNQIQMTSGGAVLATSSGITSGSASASFSGSVLVVNAAAVTPANLQCASVLLGNNIANSKYLTLAPPNAMAANYGLTLPALPGSTLPMVLATSGTMSTQQLTIPMLVPPGQGVSSPVTTAISTSAFTTIATTPSLTTNGGPVIVTVESNVGGFTTFSGGGLIIQILRDSTVIYQTTSQTNDAATNSIPAAFMCLDPSPSAAAHTYTVKAQTPNSGGGGGTATAIVIKAQEIR